jgi:hypothetical protein
MRKILTAATAALTLAGALVATTAPVQAQTRGHGGSFHGAAVRGGGFRGGGYRGGYGYRGGGYRGYGIGAGLAGFALGAALASPYYGYGYGPYYDYGPGYYGYANSCAQRVWDPYWGRWTVRYYC